MKSKSKGKVQKAKVEALSKTACWEKRATENVATVLNPEGVKLNSRGQGHAFCARRPRIAYQESHRP